MKQFLLRSSLLAMTIGFIPLTCAAEAALPPSPLALMPVPAHVTLGAGRLEVDAHFRVNVSGHDDARLRGGLDRFAKRWAARTGTQPGEGKTPPALVIECAAAARPIPALGDDESYTLEVTAKQVRLQAPNVVGALRGFETLLQLLTPDGDSWFLPQVRIEDRPRFPWRGLMIDACRHWQPMDVIKRNLDGMAVVKLNVLHFHLTEDQGFRIESRTHPELHEQGSDGNFFTQAQMKEIIAYAADRGIRVVPEFDMPGHATSWLVSHPELGSAPGPYTIERHWGIFDPVLDPTNEKVYALLGDFLGEMAELFPDPYLHIGGDENNGKHWSANAALQAFIREHNLKDNEGLHAYFNGRLATILKKHGKRIVGWDEILHPDLPKDSVIQSWRGPEGIVAAAKSGRAVILSNGYYIDINYPASDHYVNDPLPAGTPLSAEEQKLVWGGEATMWAEWVTPATVDTRIWPRTAVIAERLWSPREVNDVPDMYRRLALVSERLTEAGTRQGNGPRVELPGVDAKGTQLLTALAALVEPVKGYRRQDLQPGAHQLRPTNELADWALPESRSAREFNTALLTWLAGPSPRDPARLKGFVTQLRSWEEVGLGAAQIPAGPEPIPQARIATARALAAVCRVGIEALEGMRDGQNLSADWRQRARAAIAAAAEPNAAAVTLPFVPGLSAVVIAAGAGESAK